MVENIAAGATVSDAIELIAGEAAVPAETLAPSGDGFDEGGDAAGLPPAGDLSSAGTDALPDPLAGNENGAGLVGSGTMDLIAAIYVTGGNFTSASCANGIPIFVYSGSSSAIYGDGASGIYTGSNITVEGGTITTLSGGDYVASGSLVRTGDALNFNFDSADWGNLDSWAAVSGVNETFCQGWDSLSNTVNLAGFAAAWDADITGWATSEYKLTFENNTLLVGKLA